LVDVYYIFMERLIYDAGLVTVPTLIIRGADDPTSTDDDAQGLFKKLVRAPYKRYVVVGDGSHFVTFERNRTQVFREVRLFLEDNR
jgi:pimeloyl-ACP methyl ester carboxylesterase